MARSTDELAYDPGRLRHRVEIQALRPTAPPSYDDAGPKLKWTMVLRTKAEILPASASDVIRSGQAVSQVQVPIRVRYRREIAAEMRVVRLASGDQYTIKGMLNLQERNRWLILMCVALGPNE
jgi:SPP1 family predicted phage head-tail adaptor